MEEKAEKSLTCCPSHGVGQPACNDGCKVPSCQSRYRDQKQCQTLAGPGPASGQLDQLGPQYWDGVWRTPSRHLAPRQTFRHGTFHAEALGGVQSTATGPPSLPGFNRPPLPPKQLPVLKKKALLLLALVRRGNEGLEPLAKNVLHWATQLPQSSPGQVTPKEQGKASFPGRDRQA